MYVYIKLKKILTYNSYIILAYRNNENLVELIDSLVSWRSYYDMYVCRSLKTTNSYKEEYILI